MTPAGGATAPTPTQAELAAAVLAEEERRQREAEARAAAHDPAADVEVEAILAGRLLPAASAPGTTAGTRRSLRASLAAVRRIDAGRRLGTAQVALVAAAVALAGLLGRAAGSFGGPGLLAIVAAAGVVTGGRQARSWSIREAPARLRALAVATAVAAVLTPFAAGLPDLLARALGAAVLGLLVHGALAAVVAAGGAVAAAARPGALVASALRAAVLGALGGLILQLMVDGTSDLRALVVGVAPVALLAAGTLAAAGSALTADVVAARRADARDGDAAIVGTGAETGQVDPSRPALEIRNLDFSYGHVQVLFDVSVDVHHGEVLALLGTNGAGKSTLLRAVSGLSPVDRGTIHHRGVDITFAEAGDRVRAGIVQLPGGKAVFPSLTVVENLLAGGYPHIWDKPELSARIDEVVGIFPVLRERLDQPAGTLSGGEQQMLAFAKALLLDPDVLCIDELSLGLAPVVVQELLAIVERLKERGLTMVIVEQSLNVALAIADRAVFMEKGRVRFDGPARELAERGDLARAVFLGGEGG